jgi:hypothetical protein
MRSRYGALLLSSVLLAAVSALAQLKTPEIGAARYGAEVHKIYGLDANFIVGPEWLTASAVSFSQTAGLVAHAGRIQLLSQDGTITGEYGTSETAPLLGIGDSLHTAIAWLPDSQTLLWWANGSFHATPLAGALPGAVSSVQSDGQTARLLVTISNGSVTRVIVDLNTGNLRSAELMPGVHGPAFAIGNFILFRHAEGLAIEDGNGTIHVLDFPAPDPAFEQMSSDWVHLHSPSLKQDWALHLNNSICKLSLLPPAEFGK